MLDRLAKLVRQIDWDDVTERAIGIALDPGSIVDEVVDTAVDFIEKKLFDDDDD